MNCFRFGAFRFVTFLLGGNKTETSGPKTENTSSIWGAKIVCTSVLGPDWQSVRIRLRLWSLPEYRSSPCTLRPRAGGGFKPRARISQGLAFRIVGELLLWVVVLFCLYWFLVLLFCCFAGLLLFFSFWVTCWDAFYFGVCVCVCVCVSGPCVTVCPCVYVRCFFCF